MNYDPTFDQTDPAAQAALEDAERDERSSKRRIWIIGAIVLVVLVGVWYAGHTGDEEKLGADTETQIPVVSVTSPGRGAVAGAFEATGTIAPRRELPVGVAGEGGSVTRVLVDAGDWVRSGQVLAVIDRSVQTQQQASLAAQVDVAAADARLAQSNLDRALKLVDRGFISKADVDRLTAERDAARARVQVARAQLGELRARTNRLNIVAPAAGLVLERNVDPGQVVGAGTGDLFRLAKGGEMELLARLSEDDLARLSPGMQAQVTPVGSDKTITGQIWQIAPVVSEQDRQGTARIAMGYDPALRPGGFASARIMWGNVVAPLLPESAVQSDAAGTYVYVVGKDNKVVRTPVKTGLVTRDGIAIVDGLSGTEKVVLRAGGFLNEGDTVKTRLVKTGG